MSPVLTPTETLAAPNGNALDAVSSPIKVAGCYDASPELGVEHEAARVHNASRRRGDHLAAHRTRTAAAENANHRVSGRRHVFCLDPMDRGVCSKTARAWLGRGPHCYNRISLGR